MAKLCFGGTFNPIHHGHLICSRAVAEASGFDQVVLIPNSFHNLRPKLARPEHGQVHPEHRLEMCRRAAMGSSFFEVDDLEIHRPGPSYTFDTMLELKRRGWS